MLHKGGREQVPQVQTKPRGFSPQVNGGEGDIGYWKESDVSSREKCLIQGTYLEIARR